MSSAILIAIIVGALLNNWLFLLVILAFTIAGLYEFFYAVKKKEIPIYSYTGIAIGVLIPLSTFFRFAPTKGWELLFIVLLLLMIFFLQFMRKENVNALVGISTTLFGVLYVSWLLSFVIKLKFVMPGTDGVKLVGFILLVTKCGDIGALVGGTYFGRTPLLPRVSPNKTVEGSLGGLIFSGLAAIFGAGLIPEAFGFPMLHIIMMGVFFGGLGQLGDLSESLLKRDLQVKDSSGMFFGLGGALDLLDSVLFSAPVFYFYISSLLRP